MFRGQSEIGKALGIKALHLFLGVWAGVFCLGIFCLPVAREAAKLNRAMLLTRNTVLFYTPLDN